MLAERRLTRAELARRAHVSKTTLQDIIDIPNRSPTARTIQKLARALEVSHEWLATGRISSQKTLAAFTPEDRDTIARALSDAIQKKAPHLGPAVRAALTSELLDILDNSDAQ